MIRVLQVVTHMNRGGLETMLMNYYRQIDKSLIQFDFLTHREYCGDYDEEIKRLGGEVYHLPRLNPFSYVYRMQLNEFFKHHPEYSIVHVHQDCMSSIILKAAKNNGVRVRIAHSHNANQDKNVKFLIKAYYMRFTPKYATELMACSESAGKWMYRGLDFDILNNAIDAKSYAYDPIKREEIRKQWAIPDYSVVFGHVGRFSTQKNHMFLIDVFVKILKMRPDSVLMLVGNDTQENAMEVKAKIESCGIPHKVIFTGSISNVPEILQAMDVFLFPSLFEGLPVTLVEAQASGLPCLISDRVSIECKKTDLVEQIPLSAGAEFWAEKAIEKINCKRRNRVEDIKCAKYDIVENTKWLQDFYLSQEKKAIIS